MVISGRDAEGALPLAHSPCTVVKVNGDYLDTRLRNTVIELAAYESALERLLDQIFDEYGILVCGWSGEWDVGLCNAWKRAPNRRFPAYWASYGEIGASARSLATFRQATVFPIQGADECFEDLGGRLQALSDLTSSDVISPKVAVARMKRYLSESTQQIALADLLASETEKAHRIISGAEFSPQVPWTGKDGALERIRAYEAVLNTLLPLATCGAHWANPTQDELLVKCFKRLADLDGPSNGLNVWLSLRHYPALFLLYAMGLAAIARNRYGFLRSLFSVRVRTDRYRPTKPACAVINDQATLTRQVQKEIFANQHTPLSNYLFESLREPLLAYLPSDLNYEDQWASRKNFRPPVLCYRCDSRGKKAAKET